MPDPTEVHEQTYTANRRHNTKNDLKATTKETRARFYNLCRKLKSNKIAFTLDQLQQRLPDQDCPTFKETRSWLTTWLKTGLLEILVELLCLGFDFLPPLLIFRTYATDFHSQYEDHLRMCEKSKTTPLTAIILEANRNSIPQNKI